MRDAPNTTTTYTYDGLNRLKTAHGSYVKDSPLTPGGGMLEDRTFRHTYEYAPNGNLMSKNMYDSEGLYGPVGPESDTWNYDYANHAATAIDTTAHGEHFTMEYDAAGKISHEINISGFQKLRYREKIYVTTCIQLEGRDDVGPVESATMAVSRPLPVIRVTS